MWGAVHGDWCSTKVWSTRCRRCGDDVYFFSCACGCRVLFDSLGIPWPIHDCDSSWVRNLKRERGASGEIVVNLTAGVTITRPPEKFSISGATIAHLQKSQRGQRPDPIVAISPSHKEQRRVIGLIREIHRQVDPYKYLRVEDTTITQALIGPIGIGEIGRITIHEPIAGEATQSFTSWIRDELLVPRDVARGITVLAHLRSVLIMSRSHEWFCDAIDLLD